MQLFSRNKALIALSLGALAALGACGDDVTVSQVTNPVTVTITPQNSTLNVGEKLTLAVQVSGGSTTTPPTLASCTSSDAAKVSVAMTGSTCVATAVAAGNVSIEAKASTGQSASASITVAAPAPAISGISITPAAASIAVNGTATITANPTTAAPGATVTKAYVSSNTAVATVSSTGVITGVSAGQATITVTLTGSGTGLTTANVSGQVAVTVTALPPAVTAVNVTPQSVSLIAGGTQALTATATYATGNTGTITYGTSNPGVATVSSTGVITAVAVGTANITVTASSAGNASFSASSVSAIVPVTVVAPAQVTIMSLTDNGGTIDITNVIGQIEVNLNLQPGGQNVSSVQAWVCDQAETLAACQTRLGNVPSAQQSFGSQGANAGAIQLYINTAEFATPNFTTGADAATTYKNGLKNIIATLTTNPATTGAANASNTITSVNFNNPDGWTMQWTLPNRAQDAAGVTWYGGPNTPDALVPGSTSGTGSFVVVPVVYTPNRTVLYANMVIATGGGLGCGSAITDSIRPFGASYGAVTRSTASTAPAFNCSGTASSNNTVGYVPQVSGVDNTNAGNYPTAGIGTDAVGTSVFTQISNLNAPALANRYRWSSVYRPLNQIVPGDYAAPAITNFDVRGGGAVSVDSGWTNAAYALDGRASNGAMLRYVIADANVGLLPTRNTVFDVCNVPATISTTAPTLCATPVASGPLSSTIGSLGLPENATNFTNQAYFAIARETDRLGNRATSNPYQYTPTGGSTVVATSPVPAAANGAPGGQTFGVDLTAPVVVAIPNTGVGVTPNFARTDVDSIYSALGATYGTTNNANAVFGIRFTDARAGFFNCVAGVNCPAGGNVRGGTYQIVRRSAPSLLSVTNDATVTNLVSTSTSANQAIVATAGTFSGDPSIREFYVNIFGDAARASASVAPTVLATQDGYYTFSGTLADRAGNTTTITPRSVAIDNTDPNITGLTVPAILGGGTTVAFGPTGTDALEVMAGDLALRYPQLGYDFGNGAVVVGQPNTIRFRRVPNYTATEKLGFWHNPFAAVSDNKLTTPIGAGTTLGSAQLNVPIPFIQHIVTVNNANAPLTQAQYFGLFGGAADPRPNQVTAWLYDIRNSAAVQIGTPGISAAQNAPIFGGQISTPSAIAGTKDWAATTGITSWAIFNATSVSGFEYRATTSTSVTNPPFSAVYIVRQVGATEWEYLGQASALGQLDQGANRFWRYGFTVGAINQGAGAIQAALANGDVLRAIGVDASGNGLSTISALIGLPPAFPSTVTVTNTAVPASFTNAAAASVITLGTSANPNAVNVIYTCSSNSPFLTAQMTTPTDCTLTPNGVAAGTVNVTVTFTATGSLAGYNSTTITNSVATTRIP
jgi:uncharacterized protein YjdB